MIDPTDTDPTHIVTFRHPNSLLPTNWGYAEVEDDSDKREILYQAMTTDPHHPEPDEEEMRMALETCTVYEVDGTLDISKEALTTE